MTAALAEGKAPGFSTPLGYKRSKPGENVIFECVAYGKPFPNIKWLKDGLELLPGRLVSSSRDSSDDGIKFESDEKGTQRLLLSNIEFTAEGYYRCVATNEHGTASTKAELTIEGSIYCVHLRNCTRREGDLSPIAK